MRKEIKLQMSEKVLNFIYVTRLRWLGWIIEVLVITSTRVFVKKVGDITSGVPTDLVTSLLGLLSVWGAKHELQESEEHLKANLEEFLNADRKTFAILHSEITEVELKKGWLGTKLNITTD